jgi:hypothetical protein
VTPAEFKAAFPMFSSTTDPVVQRHIDAALESPGFDEEMWGTHLAAGLGYLVAHEIFMENKLTAAGTTGTSNANANANATTKTVGRVSVTTSFSSSSSSSSGASSGDDWFRQSFYGQKYIYLRDSYAGFGALAL